MLTPDAKEFVELVKMLGWSQSEAGRQLHKTSSYINMIFRGKAEPTDSLLKLAKMIAAQRQSSAVRTDIYKDSDLIPVRKLFPFMVPVISWASAGAGGNYSDLEDFLDEKIPCDTSDPNAFALIVDGDSMEPGYRPGDRIIVTPNSEARTGDVVIARVDASGEVFFKLYHALSGDKIRLTSYNPAYPPIEYRKKQLRFIYPVYASLRKRTPPSRK